MNYEFSSINLILPSYPFHKWFFSLKSVMRDIVSLLIHFDYSHIFLASIGKNKMVIS
ncbi:MAG: hypothetical protein J6Y39_07990 [Bacteroidaceae bacterium]|nr:hypothetical protein [Bacteroidaceae bacterium]